MVDRSGKNRAGTDSRKRFESRIAFAGLGLAFLTALVVILAGLGSREGWWNFRTGFMLLQWGGYLGLIAAGISLGAAMAAWTRRSRRALIAAGTGIVIALVIVGTLWQWKQTALRVPPIHDITTDTENPPVFVAILPLRADAPNPATYGGPEIAAQQRRGYPDLAPLTVSVPPARAFEIAQAAANDLCWKIVDSDADKGRIEATATTFWFGFKDDIVVRIQPVDGGSRIDVRSVSRVGRSDVGTNAKRIQRFLEKVRRHA